jgi:hypothetical protein
MATTRLTASLTHSLFTSRLTIKPTVINFLTVYSHKVAMSGFSFIVPLAVVARSCLSAVSQYVNDTNFAALAL